MVKNIENNLRGMEMSCIIVVVPSQKKSALCFCQSNLSIKLSSKA